VSWIAILDENVSGGPADAKTALEWATSTKIDHAFPVTADPTKQIFKATPYTGLGRPGKCVVSPEMKILNCYIGADDTAAFNAIKADAGG
jgi:hypothetical protein